MRSARWAGIAAGMVVALAVGMAAAPTATAATQPQQTRYQSAGVSGYQYYLSLGDSLGFGYSDANLATFEGDVATGEPAADALTAFAGYTQDLSAYTGLAGATTNLSCPGETTTSMIDGPCAAATVVSSLGLSWPYAGSQLSAAAAVLSSHRGQRGLITLSIGADDLLGALDSGSTSCLSNPTCPQIAAAIKTVHANLATILTTLRRAAPRATIVVLAPYNPFGHAVPISNIAAVALDLTISITGLLHGARVADAFVPINVRNAGTFDCGNLVYYCVSPANADVHPTADGYSVIAQAFEKALG